MTNSIVDYVFENIFLGLFILLGGFLIGLLTTIITNKRK